MPFSEEMKARQRTAAQNTAQQQQDAMTRAVAAWQKDPNQATAAAMLQAINPLIDRAIAGQLRPQEVHNPLMRSRARVMAVRALQRFDPQTAQLSTFVFGQLAGLKRAARQQQQIISIPERQALERAHLKKLEAEMADELGRTPADSELADRSGLSVQKIRSLQRLGVPSAEGSFSRWSYDDGDFGSAPASTIPGAPNQKGWLEIVRGDLDPIDQDIFDYSLGFNQKPMQSTQWIADRFKMSPSAVSQRKAKIQAKLDMEGALSPFNKPVLE